MLEVDGSHGEGGGQILRTAVSLSAISGQEVTITRIRAGRPDPGIKPQHLAGVRLIERLCNASVEGADPGSMRLRFSPGRLVGGRQEFDVGTAGSLTLLIQTVLPALVRSSHTTELRLTGGTDVRWSPPIDHFRLVLLPLLSRMGARVRLEVERRGFYPKGGGVVRLVVEGGDLRPLHLEERGELRRITGVAAVQNLPGHVADRMANAARSRLGGYDPRIERSVGQGVSAGAVTVLAAEYENTVLGGSRLGERGVPAERVGDDAASDLMMEMEGGGTLDVHTADQLLPFLALAEGDSVFRVREVTGHLSTQIWLLPKLLPVRIKVEEGATSIVRVSRT